MAHPSSRTCLAAGLALAFLAAPAWAQQSQVTELNTVNVQSNVAVPVTTHVGGKTPQALRDVPQSVSVITRELIEDRDYTTLDEMARTTPGLRVLNNDNGRSSIYSRGYEFSEYNIDGLPAPMTSNYGTLPDLAAFEQVGILRGPAGLFNSTSSMGGVLNLQLKRPTERFQAHFRGRYGSWNRRSGLVDVSGPLSGSGSVKGRFVGAASDSDGHPDGNENAHDTLYGIVDASLGRATDVSLAWLHQNRDITPNNGLPTNAAGQLLDFPGDAFYGADWNRFNTQSDDVIAELNHDFSNGAHGRVAARYSQRDTDMNYVFGGSALHPDGTVDVAGLGADVGKHVFSMDVSYSLPFQALGQTSNWTLGMDYKRYKTDKLMRRARGLGSVDEAGFRDFAYIDILATGGERGLEDATEKLESWGAYSKLTFRPLASLALIGGLRIGNTQVTYADHLEHDRREREDNGKITPFAGLVYDLTDHQSLYASYSQLFEAQTSIDVNGNLLEPREGEQYELGIKGSYHNGALNSRLSLFYMTDKNSAVPVAPRSPYSVALGERKVKGVEVEVAGSPMANLDLIAGYTYLDTEVVVGTARDEGIFMLMPKQRGNLWAKYHFTRGALAGLDLGMGVSAVGSFDSSQGIHAPGYATVDALIGYHFTKRLSAKINLNNLLDKDYYARVGSMGTFNLRGEPANVMATISYQL